MIQLASNWLAAVPWSKVEALHQELCHARQLDTGIEPNGLTRAREEWETAARNHQTLLEALDLCKRCIQLKPFEFMNANTMTTTAKKMLEHGLERFPSVEAQIVRTTVAHYVAGQIPKKELQAVLGHFEKLWRQALGQTVPAVPASPPLVRSGPRHVA